MARKTQFETYDPKTGILTVGGEPTSSDSAITDPNRGIINKDSVNMPSRDLGVTNAPITGELLDPVESADFNTYDDTDVNDITDITAEHEGGSKAPDLTGTQKTSQSLSDRLAEINKGLLGQVDYELEQEETQGVLDLEASKQTVSDKIKAFNRQAQALSVTKGGLYEQESGLVAGKGVTMAGLRGRVSQKSRAISQQLRDNAFNVISLSAEHDVLSGDLVSAQNKVDRAMKEKYGALLEEKDIMLDNLDIIKESEQYTEEEKDRAEDRTAKVEAEKKVIEDKAEEEKTIKNIALEALKNTNDKGINDIINQAETVEEATEIAGKLLDGTGWKTINPAEIAIMEAQGMEVYTAGGRAFARPAGQESVQDLMMKYPDAGISPNDSWEVASSKLSNSKIYQKATRITGGGGGDNSVGISKDDIATIEANLLNEVGDDSFLHPDDYNLAKEDWIRAGGAAGDFDKKFATRRNPENEWYEITGEIMPYDEFKIQEYIDDGYNKDELIEAGFDEDTVDMVLEKNEGESLWNKFWK